jgi:hypothetical protein
LQFAINEPLSRQTPWFARAYVVCRKIHTYGSSMTSKGYVRNTNMCWFPSGSLRSSPGKTTSSSFCIAYQLPQLTVTGKMYPNTSTPATLANVTLTQPVKLPYPDTISAGLSGSCSCTALVVSTALLSGILGGPILIMGCLLLFRKCWAGRTSLQNDSKESKSKEEEAPQSGRQDPCSRLVYCRGCPLNQH